MNDHAIPTGATGTNDPNALTVDRLSRSYQELLVFLGEIQRLQNRDTISDLLSSYRETLKRILPVRGLTLLTIPDGSSEPNSDGVIVSADAEGADIFDEQSLDEAGISECPDCPALLAELREQGIVNWAMMEGRPMTLPMETDSGEELFGVVLPMVRLSHPIGAVVFFTPHELTQQDMTMGNILTAEITGLYYQMKLKARVQKASDFLKQIFSSLADGIIALSTPDENNSRRIVELSIPGAAILGINLASSIGKRPSEVFGQDFCQFLDTLMKRTVQAISDRNSSTGEEEKSDGQTFADGQAFAEAEIEYQRKGAGLPLQVSCRPIVSQGSPAGSQEPEHTGFVMVVRDMTLSRELERLREFTRMKDEFISNVSHELKTPLTSIIAYADILGNEFREFAQQGIDISSSGEFLTIITSEANRLKDMINDVLDLQKFESGAVKFKEERVDLFEIMDDCVKIIMTQAEANGCRLILDNPGKVLLAQGDFDRIKQAFINVVGNAVKYSPHGGDVNIDFNIGQRAVEGSADQTEPLLSIAVRDHGIGISAEDLKKVFSKFFRADNSITYEIGGTGLGLSIVKSIVEGHRGTVKLESELGAGTSFIMNFPLISVVDREDEQAAVDSHGLRNTQIPGTAESMVDDDDPLAGLFDI